MKIGGNIKEIREIEKNFKRSYVAERLNISTRAYCNIENNVSDITLHRLEEISAIFECSALYILNYRSSKKEFFNHFHNNKGSQSTNIMHQGSFSQSNSIVVQKLLEELLESERSRIALLEALLRKHNINF